MLKKKILIGICLLAILLPIMVGIVRAQDTAQINDIVVEVILDSSQQMKKEFEEKEIFDVLHENLPQLLRELPAGTPVAIRTYGHRIGNREKAKSCEDSELISPLGETDAAQVASQVSKLNTKGFSPLAFSLKKVPADLGHLSGKKLVLVLVTTAPDSCAGDVLSAAQALKTENTAMAVFGVNFFGDNSNKEELLGISEFGAEGGVFDVTSESEAAVVFQEIAAEISGIVDQGETDELPIDSIDPVADADPIVENTDPIIDEGDNITSDESPVVSNDEDLSVAAFNFTQTKLFRYGMIGLVVLLIIGGVVYFVVGRKKKNLAQAEPIAQPGVPQPQQPAPIQQQENLNQPPSPPHPSQPQPVQKPPTPEVQLGQPKTVVNKPVVNLEKKSAEAPKPVTLAQPTQPVMPQTVKPEPVAQKVQPIQPKVQAQPQPAADQKTFDLSQIKMNQAPPKDESVSLERMIAPEEPKTQGANNADQKEPGKSDQPGQQ